MSHSDRPKNAVALFTKNACSALSDEEQQQVLRDFASKHQLTIVSFLAIENQLQSVHYGLDRCYSLKASHIIFDQTATLALPPSELLPCFNRLCENGLTIAFALEGALFNANALSAAHALMSLSLSTERRARSKKIKKALQQKKRQGLLLGGQKFGLRADEAAIIPQLLTLKNEGLPLQKICDWLTAADIKTVRGKRWHPTTIKRILMRAQ